MFNIPQSPKCRKHFLAAVCFVPLSACDKGFVAMPLRSVTDHPDVTPFFPAVQGEETVTGGSTEPPEF